jgi:hypothetical protein
VFCSIFMNGLVFAHLLAHDPLKVQNKQHRSQTLDAARAIVLEALLALSRQEGEHAYAWEIANEANGLVGIRGQSPKLSPEKAGH